MRKRLKEVHVALALPSKGDIQVTHVIVPPVFWKLTIYPFAEKVAQKDPPFQ